MQPTFRLFGLFFHWGLARRQQPYELDRHTGTDRTNPSNLRSHGSRHPRLSDDANSNSCRQFLNCRQLNSLLNDCYGGIEVNQGGHSLRTDHHVRLAALPTNVDRSRRDTMGRKNPSFCGYFGPPARSDRSCISNVPSDLIKYDVVSRCLKSVIALISSSRAHWRKSMSLVSARSHPTKWTSPTYRISCRLPDTSRITSGLSDSRSVLNRKHVGGIICQRQTYCGIFLPTRWTDQADCRWRPRSNGFRLRVPALAVASNASACNILTLF